MIEWHERLPSTMEAAHDLASRGAPHGSAVAAREQVRGRGRRGRPWVSPPGGLWLSVVLRPGRASPPECLSLRIGLALATTLEDAVPALPVLGLKWPNDVYLGDRKAGGVLSEARWDGDRLAWVVVGVGLNVTNPVPAELSGSAARLAEAAPGITAEQLATPVARAVSNAGLRPGPLTGDELEAFARRDWLRGRALLRPAAGTAQGVSREGALLVAGPGGRVLRFTAGDAVALA